MHPTTIKQAYLQLHAGFKSAVKELVAKLCFLGYADTTVSFYEQGAVHFSFWLAKRRISPSQIKESHFTDFLSHHQPMCECPFGGVRQRNTVRAGLGHFAAILRSAGYLAPAEASEAKGVDLEVRHFDEYMLNTAGLQDATRLYRRRYVPKPDLVPIGPKTSTQTRLDSSPRAPTWRSFCPLDVLNWSASVPEAWAQGIPSRFGLPLL